MPGSLEEADLRAGIRAGGRLLGAFIVARSEDEFVVYLRSDWVRGRGFKIVRTWRGGSGDRSFRNLQSAWCFIRKFGYFGKVGIFTPGDLELRQFVGVCAGDLEESPRIQSANEAHTVRLRHALREPVVADLAHSEPSST